MRKTFNLAETLLHLKASFDLDNHQLQRVFSLSDTDLKLLELGLSPEEYALLKQKVRNLQKILTKLKKHLKPQELVDLLDLHKPQVGKSQLQA